MLDNVLRTVVLPFTQFYRQRSVEMSRGRQIRSECETMRRVMPWQVGRMAAVLAIGLAGCLVPAPIANASSSSTPLYGVTIDRIVHIATIVAAEKVLPERP